MSGYQRLLTRAQVEEYEPDWVSDMQFAMQMDKYANNPSAFFAMAEEFLANKKRQVEKAQKEAEEDVGQ